MSTACQPSNSPTKAKNIQIRRVMLNDPSQVPSDLSSTPGGTLFSTTPGGTRLVYDRAFLLECRNSPLANSPPAGLPQIPGVTCTSLSPSQRPIKNGISPTARHAPHHTPAVGTGVDRQAPVAGVADNSVTAAAASPTKKTAQPGHGDEPMFEMDM